MCVKINVLLQSSEVSFVQCVVVFNIVPGIDSQLLFTDLYFTFISIQFKFRFHFISSKSPETKNASLHHTYNHMKRIQNNI